MIVWDCVKSVHVILSFSILLLLLFPILILTVITNCYKFTMYYVLATVAPSLLVIKFHMQWLKKSMLRVFLRVASHFSVTKFFKIL